MLFRSAEDVAARYGGEEFAVLCRDNTVVQGFTLGERLRVGIQATPVPHLELSIAVTVSAGVASTGEPNVGVERDASYSNVKVLGVRQPLCPGRTGLLRVQVAASRAVGYFALTVYSGIDNGLGIMDFPQVQPIPSMPFTGE